MSLETEIQNLTAAVENLAFIIKQMNVIQKPTSTDEVCDRVFREDKHVYAPLRADAEVKGVTVTETQAPAVISVSPAPMPPVAAVYVEPVPVVAMPPMPTFITPAPQPAQVIHSKAPFNDAKGLMTYVMASYQSLGPEKGAQIQNVLSGLGYQNINDIKPEHYDALFVGVEALK